MMVGAASSGAISPASLPQVPLAPPERHLEVHRSDSESLDLHGYRLAELANSVVVHPEEKRSDAAVLALPGLGRYFSQMELGERFRGVDLDLVGLDIRGYGRQYLRTGRSGPFNYVEDLSEYWDDIDDAIAYLVGERGYRSIVLLGDSTGGLTATSYAAFGGARPGHEHVKMLVLCSPLLQFNRARLSRLDRLAVRGLGRLLPRKVVHVDRVPARDEGGRRAYWFDRVCRLRGHTYDPSVAPLGLEKPVYMAYMGACLRMIRKLHRRGTSVPVPALMLLPATDLAAEAARARDAERRGADPAEGAPEPLFVDPHIDVARVQEVFGALFGEGGASVTFERGNHEVLLSEWRVVDEAILAIGAKARDAGVRS